MLHTLWVTESAFNRVEDFVHRRNSSELYIMHAQQDLDSMRYVLLIECSDSDATYLQLLSD
jgi:hypothetical protein